MINTKICKNCSQTKESNLFYNDLRFKDGLSELCLECRKILRANRQALYRQTPKNREYRTQYFESQASKERRARYIRTHKGKFRLLKSYAKRRELDCTLTLIEYESIINQGCYYCHHKLPETGFGLDRMDNNQGYTINNILPCCDECNVARSNHFSVDEMLVIGRAIKSVKDARI